MISGFTILKNGVQFGYPFRESIESLVPLVDQMVVAVGKSEDNTLEAIQKLKSQFEQRFPKVEFKIIETVWDLADPDNRTGGKILSDQTNLALLHCAGEWCFYLQADEVLHENDYPKIKAALEIASKDPSIEAVVFDYIHFYGSFDVVQVSRSSYRREVRMFRKNTNPPPVSVGDAQSFRHADGTKLSAIRTDAKIYHYGWVRPPQSMKSKTQFMDELYHGDTGGGTGDNYRYKRILGLRDFSGTHPKVMKELIKSQNWDFNYKSLPLEWTWRDAKKVALDAFERFTGVRLFEYKSYKLIK